MKVGGRDNRSNSSSNIDAHKRKGCFMKQAEHVNVCANIWMINDKDNMEECPFLKPNVI